jgi:hypothetical protein
VVAPIGPRYCVRAGGTGRDGPRGDCKTMPSNAIIENYEVTDFDWPSWFRVVRAGHGRDQVVGRCHPTPALTIPQTALPLATVSI